MWTLSKWRMKNVFTIRQAVLFKHRGRLGCLHDLSPIRTVGDKWLHAHVVCCRLGPDGRNITAPTSYKTHSTHTHIVVIALGDSFERCMKQFLCVFSLVHDVTGSQSTKMRPKRFNAFRNTQFSDTFFVTFVFVYKLLIIYYWYESVVIELTVSRLHCIDCYQTSF
jgi:hypothetical protein